MKRIVLASASPRREAILRQIGIDFEVITPNISEDIDFCLKPETIAEQLSRKKAEDVASRLNGNALIIAADTIVIKDEKVLGKPADSREAFEMLKLLEGCWHKVITGFTIIDNLGGNPSKVSHETTEVKMRELSDEDIEAYISSREPFDKAGAYGAQGLGALLVEELRGCYFNVVGLPVMRIGKTLSEMGINLLKISRISDIN
ncbi:MAG: Maf family protein [Eubacteriales bacterium]|nr:Maf family protein [Eubacteriales bacterium]